MRGTQTFGGGSVISTKPTPNTAHTTSANNNLILHKAGHVVMLSGFLTTSYKCPIFTTLFTIPDGYRPINDISLRAENTNDHWLFLTTVNGGVSPQDGDIEPGTYYFTATWIA